MHRAPDESMWLPLFGAWIVSLLATMGSLFFSEVMELPPCVLCWYQRICMYPLAVIITVGLATEDRGVSRYAWPLALIGLAVATYHNLLYYHIIPDSITPCATGVSCTWPRPKGSDWTWLHAPTVPERHSGARQTCALKVAMSSTPPA